MENFSKKPKRGRPTVFTDFEKAIVVAHHLAEKNDSERTKINRIYQQRAVRALDTHPEPAKVAWLWNPEEIKRGTDRKMPRMLFVELGRLGDDDTIRAFAEEICKLKLPSMQAVRQIREWRLSQRKQAEDDPAA